MRSIAKILAVILAVAIVAGTLPAVAVADTGATSVERVGSIDLSIEDKHVTIDGASVTGEGLPSMEIDERTYSVDSLSVQTDGLTIDFNGTTYEVCSVDITLSDVGVTVSDTSIGADE